MIHLKLGKVTSFITKTYRDEKNITEYSDNVLKAYIAFRDDIKRELII